MYRLREPKEKASDVTAPPPPLPAPSAPTRCGAGTSPCSCGRRKWTYYYRYVNLDVFSRLDGSALRERRGRRAADRPGRRQHVTRAADDPRRPGSSMTSKPIAFLLANLGVTKTHNRPQTSTNYPYSEAHLKTLKYRTGFPALFDSIEHARVLRESSAGTTTGTATQASARMTPANVHHGRAKQLHSARPRPRRRPCRNARALRAPTAANSRPANRRVGQAARQQGGHSRELLRQPPHLCLTGSGPAPPALRAQGSGRDRALCLLVSRSAGLANPCAGAAPCAGPQLVQMGMEVSGPGGSLAGRLETRS